MRGFFQKPLWQIVPVVAVLFLCNFRAGAQATVYPRVAYNVGGSASESAQGIALDANTNIYLLGTFASNNVVNNVTLTNTTGWPDMFLVKFRFGPPPPAWSRAPVTDYTVSNTRVGCDAKGDVCVAGNFGGTNIMFGALTLTNNSNNYSDDVFLAQYDTSGNIKHLNQLGGSGEDSLGDMAADTNGNCYLTGMFLSPTFSAGNSNLTRQSVAAGDCFAAKYDVNGNLLWLEQGSNAHGTIVAVDSASNCYVGGVVSGAAVFDGLSPSNPITTNFLAKYSSTGTLLWVRGDITLGSRLKLDGDQNIYTAGTFSNTIQFGSLTLVNSAASTIYVAKYDRNGNALWARQLPGLGNDMVTGLTVDSSTNCWISGYDAGVDAPSQTVAVIAEMDASGNFNGVSHISSIPSTAAGVASYRGARAPADYVCGSFATNLVFNTRSFTNAGNTDIYFGWVIAPPGITTAASGTNFVCSWPSIDTNLVLETSSDMFNWSAVTNHITTVNGQNIVSNSMTGHSGFFRLRLQ